MSAPRIVIVESDPAAIQDLLGQLAAFAVEPRVVTAPERALEEVRSLQPAVVLLRIELPQVSGYSLCNKLKKDPQLASVPLVLISSDAGDDTFAQHKRLKTRAEAYLKKPYSFDLLDKTLRAVLPAGVLSEAAPGALSGDALTVGVGGIELKLDTEEFRAFAAGGGVPQGDNEPDLDALLADEQDQLLATAADDELDRVLDQALLGDADLPPLSLDDDLLGAMGSLDDELAMEELGPVAADEQPVGKPVEREAFVLMEDLPALTPPEELLVEVSGDLEELTGDAEPGEPPPLPEEELPSHTIDLDAEPEGDDAEPPRAVEVGPPLVNAELAPPTDFLPDAGRPAITPAEGISLPDVAVVAPGAGQSVAAELDLEEPGTALLPPVVPDAETVAQQEGLELPIEDLPEPEIESGAAALSTSAAEGPGVALSMPDLDSIDDLEEIEELEDIDLVELSDDELVIEEVSEGAPLLPERDYGAPPPPPPPPSRRAPTLQEVAAPDLGSGAEVRPPPLRSVARQPIPDLPLVVPDTQADELLPWMESVRDRLEDTEDELSLLRIELGTLTNRAHTAERQRAHALQHVRGMEQALEQARKREASLQARMQQVDLEAASATEELGEQLMELRTRLDEATARADAAQAQSDHAEAGLHDAVRAAQQTAEAATAEAEGLRTERERLSEELSGARADAQQAAETSAGLRAELEGVRGEVKAQRDHAGAAAAELQAQLDAALSVQESQREELETLRVSAAGELSELQRRMEQERSEWAAERTTLAGDQAEVVQRLEEQHSQRLQSREEDARAKLQSLREDLEAAAERAAQDHDRKLQRQAEDHDLQLQRLQEDLNRAREAAATDAERLRGRAEDLVAERAELQQTHEQQLAELRARLEQEQQATQSAAQEAATHAAAAEELTATVGELEVSLSTALQSHAELKAEQDALLEEASKELLSAQHRLDALQTRLEELQGALAGSEANAAALEEQERQLQARLAELQEELEAKAAALGASGEQVAQLTEQTAADQQALREGAQREALLHETLTEQEQALQSRDASVAQLRETLEQERLSGQALRAELERTTEDLQARTAELEGTREDASLMEQTLQAALSEEIAAKEAAAADAARLGREGQELTAALQAERDAHAGTTGDLIDVRGAKAGLEGELDSLRERFASTAEERDTLRETLESQADALAALAMEEESLRSQLSAAEQRLVSARREADAEIEGLRDQLESAAAANEQAQAEAERLLGEVQSKKAELEQDVAAAGQRLLEQQQSLDQGLAHNAELANGLAESERALHAEREASEQLRHELLSSTQHGESLEQQLAGEREDWAQQRLALVGELERSTRAHETALSDAQQQHEAALQRERSDHETALQLARNEHAAAVELTSSEHAAVLERREGEHAAALEVANNERAAALRQAQDEHAAALEQRQAAHEAEMARLTGQHRDEVEAIREARQAEQEGARRALALVEDKVDAARRKCTQREAELAAERLAGQEQATVQARIQQQLVEQRERNAKNEARLVRAFRKLKAEEAVRARVLKALGVATQILTEAGRSSQTAPPRSGAAASTPAPDTRSNTGSLTPVGGSALTPTPPPSGDQDQ